MKTEIDPQFAQTAFVASDERKSFVSGRTQIHLPTSLSSKVNKVLSCLIIIVFDSLDPNTHFILLSVRTQKTIISNNSDTLWIILYMFHNICYFRKNGVSKCRCFDIFVFTLILLKLFNKLYHFYDLINYFCLYILLFFFCHGNLYILLLNVIFGSFRQHLK